MTKKSFIKIFICIFVFVLMIGFWVQYNTFSTVLYEDGTLLIEQRSLNKWISQSNHGSIVKEYPSFKKHGYNFLSYGIKKPLWYDKREDITSVQVATPISPSITAYWFYGLTNVENIDVSNIDTSRTENMAYMFSQAGYNAKNFKVTGLSDWNTSNVTDMQWMFRAAGANADSFVLDKGLDHWDTSNVRIMVYMFDAAGENAKTWKIGDLSNWDTSSLIACSDMFTVYGELNPNIDKKVYSWYEEFLEEAIKNARELGLN